MAEVFSLGNALQAGDRLRQNEQNREFNTLRLSGERQRQDIQQRTFDAEQQRANSEKTLFGIRLAMENINNPGILSAIGQELVFSGIFNEAELPNLLEQAKSNPEQAMRGLAEDEAKLMLDLGQGPQFNPPRAGIDPATGESAFGQINLRTGKSRIVQGLTPPAGGGTSGSSPSAVREFQFYEGLSPKAKKRFLQVKRASGQIVDINGVPNIVDKESGGTIPLSTPEVEISAAANRASAVETAKQEAQVAALPKKTAAQARIDLPGVEAKTTSAITLIDDILDDPGLPAVIGFLQGRTRGLTGKQRGLVKKIEQVQGKVFLDAFESLKGGGQITELEGKAATDANTRINDRTVDEASFIDSMLELRGTLETGLTRAREAAGKGSNQLLQQARDAIAQGADRNAVIQRLEASGVDASDL